MIIRLADTDNKVELNHLEPISSHILFNRGGAPHPEGLLSEDIFGVSPKDRKNRYAYINLQAHFFSPHAYKVAKAIFRNIDRLIAGELFYKIVNGELVEDPEGETGLDFLYKNWKKIEWKSESTSIVRRERVDLLRNSTMGELFLSKWIVIPVFYRDVTTNRSGGGSTVDLNNLYAKLIRYATLLENRDMFAMSFHQTNLNIQMTLVDIYDYFKSKLEKKTGYIRKYLMGKSIDYSNRTVVVAPRFQANRPEELMSGVEYGAVPLHQVCSMCTPFVIKWLRDYFEQNVFDNKQLLATYDGKNIDGTQVTLDRPELYFTDEYFRKRIKNFIKNPGSRFDPVLLPLSDGKSYAVTMTGEVLGGEGAEAVGSTFGRPMTWTDLLFIACYDIVKGKHVYITRYPALAQYAIFFTKIRIASTIETDTVRYRGEVYEFYPRIKKDLDEQAIIAYFIDATSFSNSYLEGMNCDYDGDQTTERIVWSLEANKECEEQMHKKINFVAPAGKLIRTCSHEANQTLYVMTKDIDPKAKVLSKPDIEYFTSIKPEEYTFKLVSELFANKMDITNGKNPQAVPKRKYHYTDIINLEAKDSPTKTPIKTTLGRYVLYRAWIVYCGLDNLIPFFTEPLSKKPFKNLEQKIATGFMDDKMDVKQMIRYLDTRDWIGYQWHPIFCTSFSPEIVKIHPEVKKLKEKLLKDNDEALKAGDVVVSENIEKALVAKTKEVFKGNLGMDLYDSGARGSLDNNYKNTYLYRGAVANPATGKFDIIRNALSDVLDPHDIPATSNTILGGAYPKACGTAESGYMMKQLLACMQTEMLGPKDSDCGSKNTLDIIYDPGLTLDYRYIVEGGKMVYLDEGTKPKYVGKKIHLRSPMCCLGVEGKICSKCAGEQFYKQDIEAIGLLAVVISETITNGNMAKFHNNSIKNIPINPDTMLI